MALITFGAAVSNISGSVGGTTFARNRGGAYMRSRTVPLNPKSPSQFDVRLQFGALAQAWSADLDEAQRSSWDSYAIGTPIVNKLGQERLLSGINWFVGNNALNQAVGAPRIDTASSSNGVGSAFGLTVEPNAATNTFDITGFGGIQTLPASGRGLLVQISRPQSGGVNFFAGPFRQAFGQVLTDVTTPILGIPLPFAAQPGQVLFFRHTWVDIGGRGGLASVQRKFLA